MDSFGRAASEQSKHCIEGIDGEERLCGAKEQGVEGILKLRAMWRGIAASRGGKVLGSFHSVSLVCDYWKEKREGQLRQRTY